MGIKGGGTTTQSTTNEPPKWAKPLYEQSAKDTQALYKSGTGFNPYPGSTIAQPSVATKAGVQGLQNYATSQNAANLAQNPIDLTNTVTSRGGLMDPSLQALNTLNSVAQGPVDPTMAGMALYGIPTMSSMQGMFGGGVGNTAQPQGGGGMPPEGQPGGADPTSADVTYSSGGGGLPQAGPGDVNMPGSDYGVAQSALRSMASGDYLKNGNPYFQDVMNTQANQLQDRLNGGFAGAGRYGSGANTGVVGREVGNFMNQGLSSQFDRMANQQFNAATALQGNDLNRVRAAGDIMGQGTANKIQAAQGMSDISNQGLQTALGYTNALPTVQENATFAPNLLMQTGGIQDAQNQARLNDQISKFYQGDMQDWTRLGALQASAGGSAGNYGTAQSVINQPGQPINPLGILGSLFSIGSAI